VWSSIPEPERLLALAASSDAFKPTFVALPLSLEPMTSSPQSSEVPATQTACQPALTQTIRLLARLGRERFYGKLTICYEAGNIVSLRKEETFKPDDLAR
jgi:hypothetical protein